MMLLMHWDALQLPYKDHAQPESDGGLSTWMSSYPSSPHPKEYWRSAHIFHATFISIHPLM